MNTHESSPVVLTESHAGSDIKLRADAHQYHNHRRGLVGRLVSLKYKCGYPEACVIWPLETSPVYLDARNLELA